MVRVTTHEDGVSFSVKVVPRAPPVEGAANKALVKLLAKILEVPECDIEIVTGHTGRQKVVSVTGLPAHELEIRLRRQLLST
jgi:uncharacterized protein